MKRPIDIKSTFEELRNLPLEMTFCQVENWITKQQIKPVNENKWITLFLTKSFSRSKN